MSTAKRSLKGKTRRTQKSPSRIQTLKPVLELLEQKQLLDAGGFAELTDTVTFDAPVDFGPASLPSSAIDMDVSAIESSQHSTHVAFVDQGLEDIEQLVAGIRASLSGQELEIHYLQQATNGLQSITDVLQGRQGIGAIHIISHGNDGVVNLGNVALSTDNLGEHTSQLASWSNALTEDADLFFYGCELAATSHGEQLVEAIGSLTGADVAASDDLTGTSQVDAKADWDLEFKVGDISTPTLSASAWNGTLAIDTDGDSIMDNVDLDDDNDGILDSHERTLLENDQTVIFVNDNNGNLISVTDPNGTPVINNIGNMGRTFGDIAQAPDGTLYGVDFFSEDLYAIDTTTANVSLIGTIPGVNAVNSFSFDSAGTGYLGHASGPEVFQFDPTNPAGATVWHDFGSGTAGGDFVFFEGEVFVAWHEGGYTLRRVSLDAFNNVVADVQIGDLPSDSWGLSADVNGDLYAVANGSSGYGLYQLDIPDNPIAGEIPSTLVAGTELATGEYYGATSNVESILGVQRNTDRDGNSDHCDLDSDNDGISDLYESGASAAIIAADTNADGTISLDEADLANDGILNGNADADGDGLMDIFDADITDTSAAASVGTVPVDSDTDATPDYVDLDSDNDLIADTIEARPTASYDGHDDAGANNVDTDGDGVLDIFDTNAGSANEFGGTHDNFVSPEDTDNDGTPDYLDLDSDGDAKPDVLESGRAGSATFMDVNMDGIDDGLNTSYANPDGAINTPISDLTNADSDPSDADYRSLNDKDGDGVSDYADLDDDNDGILDSHERALLENDQTVIFVNDNNGNLLSVTDPNGTPVINNIGNMGRTFGDIAQAPDGTLYGVDFFSEDLYAIDTTTANVSLIGTIPGVNAVNSFSFDSAGTGYLGHASGPEVFQFDPTNPAGATVWHDFGSGTAGGDFVFFEGEVFVAWHEGGYTLRRVSLDAFNNVVADVQIGDLPSDSWGLSADVNGDLYAVANGSSGYGLYQLDIPDNPIAGEIPSTLVAGTELATGKYYGATSNVESILGVQRNTDRDGNSDHCDLDSDNDGISDLYESGASAAIIAADTNADGTISLDEADLANDGILNGNADADGDGLMDIFDADITDTSAAASVGTVPVDSDTDATPDYVDLDSDNDLIADTIEARPTASYDGHDDAGANNVDTDGDGVLDIFDTNAGSANEFGGTHDNFVSPEDTDNDGTPDYLDLDSDGDAKPDVLESGRAGSATFMDVNMDGIDDGLNTSYANPDGAINTPISDLTNADSDPSDADYRSLNDKDGDGVSDYADLDDDNDGILDSHERALLENDQTVIFVNDNNGNLLSVTDPNGTPVINNIGNMGRTFGDIAQAPDGTLYGVDFFSEDLYAIDTTTANVSLIGTIPGVNAVNSFSFDSAGTGYLGHASGPEVFQFDPTNPAGATVWHDFGSGTAGGDFVFFEGEVFVAWHEGGYTLRRVSLDAFNNVVADVQIGDLPSDSWGLSADVNGDLYAVANGSSGYGLYQLDIPDNPIAGEIPSTLVAGTELATGKYYGATSNVESILGVQRNTDRDGNSDHCDLDSDNDGISDLYESGASAAIIAADTNADGTISLDEADLANDGILNGNADADGDGLMDIFDADITDTSAAASVGTVPVDSDTDATPDYVDLDSDNDLIADTIEARPTASYDGHDDAGANNVDTDGDGVLDIFDTNAGSANEFGGTHDNFVSPEDTDNDGTPDYLDLDSDGDAKPDVLESGRAGSATFMDVNMDGIDDGLNTSYANPDGAINTPISDLTNADSDPSDADYRSLNDKDGDGVSDYADLDDDNDGILDSHERALLENDQTVIFVNDNNGNLISVTDPNGTPVINNIGNMGRTFGDIAQAPDGTLYGVDFFSEDLYAIDTTTANVSLIGTIPGVNAVNSFSFDSAGTGYLGHASGPEVFQFDPTNPAGATVWHDFGSGTAGGDFVFFEGEVFVAWHEGGYTLRRVSLDAFNNVVADVQIGDLPSDSWGLSADVNGDLYAVANGSSGYGLYQLDIPDNPIAGEIPSTLVAGTELATGKYYGATSNVESILGVQRNTDRDGNSDHCDLDSDNDGISDLYESGASAAIIAADTNADGTISLDEADLANDGILNGNADADGDGLMDIFDADITDTSAAASVGTVPVDSDTDATPDYVDLDSDNDLIADTIEARPTASYDGHDDAGANNVDTDGDGVLDIFDTNAGSANEFGGTHDNFVSPEDTDNDGTPDYLDLDSDGDAKPDVLESGRAGSATFMDVNMDGIDDGLNTSYANPDGAINTPISDLTNADSDPSDADYRSLGTIIQVEKSVGSPTTAASGIAGNFDVTFSATVTNIGSKPLTELTLTDNIVTNFGGAFVAIASNPSVVASTATIAPTVNPAFDGGTADAAIFNGSPSLLQPGQSVTIEFAVEVDPDSATAIYDAIHNGGTDVLENQMTVTGIDPDGPLLVSDLSDDPSDLTNVDGTPGDINDDDGEPDDPTKLLIADFHIMKSVVGDPVPATSGTPGHLEATFEFEITNIGNDRLTGLTLTEDIAAQWGGAFAGLVGVPTITASTAADAPEINAAFDAGLSDSDVFDNTGSNTNLLETGQSVTLQLTAEVDPDNPTAIFTDGLLVNRATATSFSLTSGAALSDFSDDPADPTNTDDEGDGEPDDPTALAVGSDVSGKVYVDANDNGSYDPGETGIIGVPITLTDISTGADITVLTDANGDYLFEDVLPGTYTVTETHPPQFGDGPEELGNQGGIANQDVFEIEVESGADDYVGYNFTETGLLPQFASKALLLASTPDDYWEALDASGVLGLWVPVQPQTGGAVDAIIIDGEAIAVDVFDEDMNPINPARTTEDGGTWVMHEGQQYYVRLSGDDADFDFNLAFGDDANLPVDLDIQDNVVVAVGTAGDDEIELILGTQSHMLVMGEYQFEFDANVIDTFHVGAATGNDSIHVNGTHLDEVATLLDSKGTFTSSQYTVYTYSFDDVTFDGKTGDDMANIYGSTGDDVMHSLPLDSTITMPEASARMIGFQRVNAFGRGGNDVASLYGTLGQDHFYTFDDYEVMQSESIKQITKGFERVNAYARAGDDTAHLFDSAGDDHFWSFSDYSVMVSDHLYAVAKGFEDVQAEAKFGGNDTFHVRDLEQDTSVTTSDDTTTVLEQTRNVTAKNFEQLDQPTLPTTPGSNSGEQVTLFVEDIRYTSNDGSNFVADDGTAFNGPIAINIDGDAAQIAPSNPDGDILLVLGTQVHIVELGNHRIEMPADAIQHIKIDAAEGSNRIHVTGTSADDNVSILDGSINLSSDQYNVEATGLDDIEVEGGLGNDKAVLYGAAAGDDTLSGLPQDSTLSSDEATYRARGFERVDAYGRGGNDIAHLYGTLGDDTYWTFDTHQVIEGPNHKQITKGFERVNAYGRAGDDNANLIDTTGDDQFWDFAQYSALVTPNVYNVVKGFESTKTEARNGGDDKAYLRELVATDQLTAQQQAAVVTRQQTNTQIDGYETVNVKDNDGGKPNSQIDNIDFVFEADEDWIL